MFYLGAPDLFGHNDAARYAGVSSISMSLETPELEPFLAKGLRVAVIVARFNEKITEKFGLMELQRRL